MRAWRTAMRPSSASLCTTLTSSLRRSSESGGQRHADEVALRGGVEPEVAVADGLLDGLGQRPCRTAAPSACRGSGAATIATWLSGTSDAVGLDADGVEQAGGRLAAADAGRARAWCSRPPCASARGRASASSGMVLIGRGSRPARHAGSRAMAPGSLMLKTTMGSWLALQSPNALASMTA